MNFPVVIMVDQSLLTMFILSGVVQQYKYLQLFASHNPNILIALNIFESHTHNRTVGDIKLNYSSVIFYFSFHWNIGNWWPLSSVFPFQTICAIF